MDDLDYFFLIWRIVAAKSMAGATLFRVKAGGASENQSIISISSQRGHISSLVTGLAILGLASCSIDGQQANRTPFKLDEVDGDSLDRLVFLEAEASRAKAERKYKIVPAEMVAQPKLAVRRRAGSADYEVNVSGEWRRCEGKLMKRATDWLQLNEGDSFFIEAWVLSEETRDDDAAHIVAIALDGGPLFFNGFSP